MQNKYWLIAVTVMIVCMMLFGNRKVRVFSVFRRQLQIFNDARKEKISVWDIICFLFFPICLAVIITIGFESPVDNNLAGVLTTVFAFVFTVLFGFAAILVGKMDGSNGIEKRVVGETFVSIVTSTILSLIAAVLSIVIIKIECETAVEVLSCIIYSISFMVVMLLLMITKRTFVIYCDKEES